MRTKDDVETYKANLFRKYVLGCEKCDSGRNQDCVCRKKMNLAASAYEACIPQDFWWIRETQVINNRNVFERVVNPYVNKLRQALKHGYGLVLLGDNGVGKTYFISYILMEAIKRHATVYYTTMPDLDYNLKRGFKNPEIEERLNWMLTSDFLAIDELGKERAKLDNKYMDAQVERILKRRLDDNYPMILATNMDSDSLDQAYGVTVASMLSGKFEIVTMEPGDFRASLRDKMVYDMGYDNE
jgi:DNA replication protein DnaC